MASIYDGTSYHDDTALIEADERQGYVSAVLTQAANFAENEVGPDRAEATDYYMGRPFGNEEVGRSQVVSTDVRDAVSAMLPSLLRVFFGPERAVEFRPRSAEDVEYAEQATEFIADIVLKVDNNGFLELYSAFKDALVRRMGIIKWWWEDLDKVETIKYAGIGEEALDALVQTPGVRILSIEQEEMTGTFEVEIEHTTTDGKIKIAAIPPEEFIYNTSARSLQDAIMVGHRCYLSAAQLQEMGYDEEVLRDAVSHQYLPLQEETARQLHSYQILGGDEAEAAYHRPIMYTESWFSLQNEEGKLGLRRICTVGDGYRIVKDEPAYEKPFALFCPDPEPHTITGLSVADRTKDIQKIKSMVLRANLDSLALTLTPATEIVEGQVNMADVLNTEVGKVVRVKAPGMMREVDHRYVGGESFPMLAYLDDMKESRTGISKQSAGLSPEVLQSTTKAGVNATVEAARQQLEMIARIFSETGMRDLMRGLLRMAIRFQSPGRIVRLRNKFVPIDPAVWDAEMDVTVNVALGSALVEDKIVALEQISAKQAEILQMFGPDNPLVTVSQYRYSLAKMIELLGFKDSSKFFKEVDEEKLAADAQKAAEQAAQQPDPAVQLAQAEVAKSQNDIQVAQAKLQLEAQRAQQEKEQDEADLRAKMELEIAKLQLEETKAAQQHAREMERIAAEAALKKLEMELRYQQMVDDAKLRADTQVYTAEIQANANRTAREKHSQSAKPDGSVTETIEREMPHDG